MPIKKRSIYDIFKEYSEEQIDNTIKTLSNSDKELLNKRYGNDLKHPEFNLHITPDDNRRFNTLLIPKIKRRLENNNLSVRRNYWVSGLSIYEYFDEYSKEEIDAMVSKLKGTDKRLLELKCNPDLESKMTKKQRHLFSGVLVPKMIYMLEEPNKEYKFNLSKFHSCSIYEYFSEYSKEHIDDALSKLTTEESSLLKLRFSTKESLPKNHTSSYYSLLKKFKLILATPDCSYVPRPGKRLNNIYEYFSEYSKEQINEVIVNLKPEELDLLKIRYGSNLEVPTINSEWNATYHTKFYKILIPKMRKMLANSNRSLPNIHGPQTIYAHFPEYSKDEVDNMLKKLNSNEKRLLNLKYGSNLDVPVTSLEMTKQEKANFQYLMTHKMKYLLENPYTQKFSNQNFGIYSYFFEYSKTQIDNAFYLLSDEEKKALRTVCGENLDIFITTTTNDLKYVSALQKMTDILKLEPPASKISSKRVISIYNYFSEYSKEDIDKMLSTLNIYERYLLRLKYGDNIEIPATSLSMTKQQKEQLRYIQNTKMQYELRSICQAKYKNINSSSSSLEILKEIRKMYHKPEFLSLLEDFTAIEATVLGLFFGLIYDVCYSIDEISAILEIDKKQVLTILKCALEEHSEK